MVRTGLPRLCTKSNEDSPRLSAGASLRSNELASSGSVPYGDSDFHTTDTWPSLVILLTPLGAEGGECHLHSLLFAVDTELRHVRTACTVHGMIMATTLNALRHQDHLFTAQRQNINSMTGVVIMTMNFSTSSQLI